MASVIRRSVVSSDQKSGSRLIDKVYSFFHLVFLEHPLCSVWIEKVSLLNLTVDVTVGLGWGDLLGHLVRGLKSKEPVT